MDLNGIIDIKCNTTHKTYFIHGKSGHLPCFLTGMLSSVDALSLSNTHDKHRHENALTHRHSKLYSQFDDDDDDAVMLQTLQNVDRLAGAERGRLWGFVCVCVLRCLSVVFVVSGRCWAYHRSTVRTNRLPKITASDSHERTQTHKPRTIFRRRATNDALTRTFSGR